MPIFGQVWLWSLLAFLLGTVLCWLLVGRPARQRVDELEHRLSRMRADLLHAPRVEAPSRDPQYADTVNEVGAVTGLLPEPEEEHSTDYGGDHDYDPGPETLTRAYALPIRDSLPPDEAAERGALRISPRYAPDEITKSRVGHSEAQQTGSAGATQYMGVLGAPVGQSRSSLDQPATAGAGGRGWFEDKADSTKGVGVSGTAGARHERRPLDNRTSDDDGGGTIFTQHTPSAPIKMGRQVEGVTREPKADSSGARMAGPAVLGAEVGSRMPAGEKGRPGMSSTGGATGTQLPVVEPAAKAGSQPKVTRGAAPQPEPSGSLLPKRVPSKPQNRHPFGVQTVSPATVPPVKSSASASDSERPRSLFEPIVPAAESTDATPPPPHQMRSRGRWQGSAGPFGSGSAMPLPGGASPSPEFTVKASVAAKRYCTPDSSQFGRTVAEVWFTDAAEAEQAGFRPVP